MGNSPYHDQFLREHNINIHLVELLPSHSSSEGWLISSPSTKIVSKMHLGNPFPTESSPGYKRTTTPRKIQQEVAAPPTPPKDAQYRLSLSDTSDPGLMDDFVDRLGWSDSEASLDELQHCQPQYQSKISFKYNPECKSPCQSQSQQAATQIWDSYWSATDLSSRNKMYQINSTITQNSNTNRDADLSPCNRNFASSNLSDLNVCKTTRNLSDLNVNKTPKKSSNQHISGQILCRSDQSLPRSCQILQPHTPKLVSQTAYSPFPSNPQALATKSPPRRPPPPPPATRLHQSWSMPPQTPPAPLRARANTTPSNFQSNRPSNLSICTTASSICQSPYATPSSTSSGLYMGQRSIAESPTDMMELMEKSFFEDSSDEDSDEDDGWLKSIRWHNRGSSHGSVEMKKEKDEKQGRKKKISLGKCTSDAINQIFGKKKASI